MNRIILFLTLALVCQLIDAQSILVSGVLRDNNGDPLPGANVINKGKDNGTVSNLDGYYEIEAEVGDILLINFIGFNTIELIVNEHGKAVSKKRYKSSSQRLTGISDDYNFQTDSNEIHDPEHGVANMNYAKGYSVSRNSRYGSVNYQTIRIKKAGNKNSPRKLIIKENTGFINYRPFIEFKSSFTSTSVSKLPKLQDSYSQGRSLGGSAIWQGPETHEEFCWGPKISMLEFDGSPYDYDKNGRLTEIGSGNGKAALAYNPYSIFKNGYNATNEISIKQGINNFNYNINIVDSRQSGYIPKSAYISNAFYSNLTYERYRTAVSGFFNLRNSEGLFMGDSPAMYHLMQAILLTPPTFDNSNGLRATNISSESYWLENGRQRSASSTNDNPFWLIKHIDDKSSAQNILTGINVDQHFRNNWRIFGNFSYQKNSSFQQTSFDSLSILFPQGHNYILNRTKEDVNNKIGLSYHPWISRDFSLTCNVGYSALYQNYMEQFNKQNYPDFPESGKRSSHSAFIMANGEIFDWGLFSASGYMNSWSDYKSGKGKMGGSVSTAIMLHQWINPNLLNKLKIKASYGNSYQAAPLLSGNTHLASLIQSADELNKYPETLPVFKEKNLAPENTRGLNLGTEIRALYRFEVSFDWFNKQTLNAILPVFEEDISVLSNIATLRTKGYEFSIEQSGKFTTRLSFTRNNTIVEALYHGLNSVPIAGFADVRTNAIEGEALGVITGSKYLRNTEGQLIIGADGFPLVDDTPGILGNPQPKWSLGLYNSLSIQKFRLSWQWYYQHKGVKWNGTRNALNYYGLSEESAHKRNTYQHIYSGITEDGRINTTPVDFANPVNGLEANKWVRYGELGVAEEAIENASFLSLRDIKITYETWLHKVKLSTGIFANNIVYLSKYSGVSVESSLFGSADTYGLDYFNVPSIKSYGIFLNLTF